MRHIRPTRVRGLLPALLVAVLLLLPVGGAAAQTTPVLETVPAVQTAVTAKATRAAIPSGPAKTSPKYARTIRDCRAAAKALLRKTGAASISLTLMSGNTVVWRQGFGYADKASSTTPRATTMYGIGSVSKMPATVATMILVDRGLVDLDAPLTRYIPTFTMADPAYRQVTVRMLLDHSSGFPGSEYANAMGYTYLPGYVDQVLDTLAGSRLKTTPGYMSVYCNDGFTLLEKLVRNVSGKSFAQFAQDEIFTPLGMTHSKYPLTHFADGTYAKCYTGSIPPTVPNRQEVVNTLASGGLYSTPSDMAKFGAMLMNRGVYRGVRILSRAAVNEMAKDQTARSYNPVPANFCRYGLGWDSVTEPGLKAVGVTAWMKGGDSSDYHAGLTVAPKVKLTAVVTGVAPLSSEDCETLAQRMILRAMIDKGQKRRMPKRLPQTAPKPKTATKTQLNRMSGVWAMYGQAVRIAPKPGSPQLLTSSPLEDGAWGEPTHVIRLRKNGRFYEKGAAANWRTIKAGGRLYLVANLPRGYGHYTDDVIIGQKLAAGDALSAAWQARLGHVWLNVNEDFSSTLWTGAATMALKIQDIPDMPGYIASTTAAYGLEVNDATKSDTFAGMFLQIPGFGSRDLNDLQIETMGAEEWVRFGYSVYRPMETVPGLSAGANTVTIGPEGYVEWRQLPNAGSVTIAGAGGWWIYDNALDPGGSGSTSPATADAPVAGCYLALFGAPGTVVTVTAP